MTLTLTFPMGSSQHVIYMPVRSISSYSSRPGSFWFLLPPLSVTTRSHGALCTLLSSCLCMYSPHHLYHHLCPNPLPPSDSVLGLSGEQILTSAPALLAHCLPSAESAIFYFLILYYTVCCARILPISPNLIEPQVSHRHIETQEAMV